MKPAKGKGPYTAMYRWLHASYGAQGWWPIASLANTRGFDNRGYHRGTYGHPKTSGQRFEICIGAILTQNAAWKNAERAVRNLHALGAINPKVLPYLDEDVLKEAIRPAGYYNMKAKKLVIFARFFLALKGRAPTREELLALWGIGPETADSILLYAYKRPEFVVDAYTRRMLLSLKLIAERTTYDEIKAIFENNVKRDVRLYQEYHALIVEHAKRHYGRKKGLAC